MFTKAALAAAVNLSSIGATASSLQKAKHQILEEIFQEVFKAEYDKFQSSGGQERPLICEIFTEVERIRKEVDRRG